MLRYAVYRLLLLIPILVGLSVVIFFYVQLIPGDPIAGMLGATGSRELVEQLRSEFGLDRPIIVQYFDWVSGLMVGDLGVSFSSRQAIAPILVERIPATLQLMGASLIVILIIGWPLGFIAGLKKDTKIDRILSLSALAGLSTPIFWIGTLLVLIFALNLGWFPSQGYVPISEDFFGALRTTTLPALSMGIVGAPYLARMTRAATVEVQQERFVDIARAKGLKRSTIIWRYSARNSVLPILVVLGLQLGWLLSGQVIVEEVFAWPGVGRLIVQGAIARDYFMIQAVVLIFAIVFVVTNLAAELAHAKLDPRIRI